MRRALLSLTAGYGFADLLNVGEVYHLMSSPYQPKCKTCSFTGILLRHGPAFVCFYVLESTSLRERCLATTLTVSWDQLETYHRTGTIQHFANGDSRLADLAQTWLRRFGELVGDQLGHGMDVVLWHVLHKEVSYMMGEYLSGRSWTRMDHGLDYVPGFMTEAMTSIHQQRQTLAMDEPTFYCVPPSASIADAIQTLNL